MTSDGHTRSQYCLTWTYTHSVSLLLIHTHSLSLSVIFLLLLFLSLIHAPHKTFSFSRFLTVNSRGRKRSDGLSTLTALFCGSIQRTFLQPTHPPLLFLPLFDPVTYTHALTHTQNVEVHNPSLAAQHALPFGSNHVASARTWLSVQRSALSKWRRHEEREREIFVPPSFLF
jgi:hypothetical protein